MKAFHETIVAKIQELDVYQNTTVKLYNSQELADIDGKEEHIFYPAVFIEYVNEENRRLAYGVIDRVLTIRFRFMFEDYTWDRINQFDLLDQFTEHMTGFRGGESDPVQFTSFEELGRDYDENHNQVNLPIIDFITVYRDVNGYQDKTIIFPNLDIQTEIDG